MTAAVSRALLCALLVACNGGRPPPVPDRPSPQGGDAAGAAAPPADAAPSFDGLADRLAGAIEALAEAIVPEGDCATRAGRARAVLDEHAVTRAEAAQAGPGLDAALEAQAARIATAVARMRPALEACAADADFAAAMTPSPLGALGKP